MMKDFLVHLNYNPMMDEVEVWAGNRGPDGYYNINLEPRLDMPGEHMFVFKSTFVATGYETTTLQPMLRLPHGMLGPLRDAIEKLGVTCETAEANKGELKATKAHLFDLQQIVQVTLGKALGITPMVVPPPGPLPPNVRPIRPPDPGQK